MDESSSKKSNVVLLTVIAIVTMIVVVIGATFAYLANQISGNEQSNINVSTEVSSDMFLIKAGDPIDIVANLENFGEDKVGQDLNSKTYGSVTFQTNSETEKTRSYNISLKVNTNNMEYTSGMCYAKTESVGETESDCTGENQIWATPDGKNYHCYTKGSKISSLTDLYTCTASDTYLWETDKVSELVLDFYKADLTKTSASSCSSGKCYNAKRELVSGVTDANTCEETDTNVWVADYFDTLNNRCYVLDSSYDVTVDADGSSRVLVENKSITASKDTGKINEYYMTSVTLRNLRHNQIQNGQKNFEAVIEYSPVVEP